MSAFVLPIIQGKHDNRYIHREYQIIQGYQPIIKKLQELLVGQRARLFSVLDSKTELG
jgi:hypothetical protein